MSPEKSFLLLCCTFIPISWEGLLSPSVQKTQWECAANMEAKSASWYINNPLSKWYMNCSIFQNIPKFQPKFWEKSGYFGQNLTQN